MRTEAISGWGCTPVVSTRVIRPDIAELSGVVKRADRLIPRGLGRGYGDCAVCSDGLTILSNSIGTIGQIENGRIVVEAGVSFDSLLRFIIPQGWFVPVTPGTKLVTVGGAIAADIHGKNHHRDGSFGEYVEWFDLMTAHGAISRVSRQEHPELFWATIGGMGLTGFVIRAAIRLAQITSSRIKVLTTRHNDLEDLMSAMLERDKTYQYTVAWVDSLAHRSHIGRSILWAGSHADLSELRKNQKKSPLHHHPRQRVIIPPKSQLCLVKTNTVRLFNEFWFRSTPRKPSTSLQSIDKFFYPLDAISNWNRLYGRDGFLQYQFSVPDSHSEIVKQFLDTVSRQRIPTFLSVLKRFGNPSGGWLSFPSPGWTLAVDIPVNSKGIAQLLDNFDQRIADAGGRVYLAKDSRLQPQFVRTMYPMLPRFQGLRKTIDPLGKFSSHLSRRLRL